jgi:prepilin-type N-terminal cleavage/methylation domain-containing protein
MFMLYSFTPRDDRPHPASFVRKGYTLLELMLALGLLGALLAVAWALMGTYRDAEQKGWQLSMRAQTVRALHDWLQQDIDHLCLSTERQPSGGQATLFAAARNNPSTAGHHYFSGTSLGFTLTIEPSLDPLPFLERLMQDADASSFAPSPANTPILAGIRPDSPPRAKLWSDGAVRIEYQLLPTSGPNSEAPANNRGTTPRDRQALYRLSRTARADPEAGQRRSSALGSVESLPADRILTTQDLYRQTDDRAIGSTGPVLEESVLHGLLNPRFRYFDGRRWRDEWSASNVAPPLAIALSFDMPQRFESISDSLRTSPRDRLQQGLNEFGDDLSLGDNPLAREPVAEIDTGERQSLIEDESHQVHIVVRAQPSMNRATPAPLSSLIGGVP